MVRPVAQISLSLAAVLISLLCSVAEAGAQQQKIGYVDTDYLLTQMSEYEIIQQQLHSMSSQWNSELQRMDKEIEQLKKDYESKKVLYTDEQKEQARQNIQSKVEQRQQYLEQKFGAEGDYFRQQKELLKPVQETIFDAINRVAERQSFDFVFDRAQNSGLLFGGEEFNLNEEVLQELGITLNESSN